MASRVLPQRRGAVQRTKTRARTIIADCSPTIDSLFDASRIKNRRHRTISWTTVMTALASLSAV
jgi:hypothetical protein